MDIGAPDGSTCLPVPLEDVVTDAAPRADDDRPGPDGLKDLLRARPGGSMVRRKQDPALQVLVPGGKSVMCRENGQMWLLNQNRANSECLGKYFR